MQYSNPMYFCHCSKDVNTVRKLVDDCVGSQLSASLRPHDAVSALGPMYHVHDRSHLPRMEACSRALSKLFEFCKTKKHEMTMGVHTTMQKVSALQSGIRDIRFQLSAFNEAMNHQDEIFAELKLVRRVGPAYRTCLAEVVRRKAMLKLYMGEAGQVAEKMARIRESEVNRREQLLKHLVTYNLTST
jgi:autophagy-related protein 11